MELIHRPVTRPSYGGHIERLIGTMMGAVHLLPGTTFSNVHAKADYPSDARATLTLAELEQWLIFEIAGTYHNRVHSAFTVVRADEAARAINVTRTLLYRLLARYRRRRHTSSLLPRTRGRTRWVVQLDEEREAIIQTAIEQVYLTEQRPSLTELLRAIGDHVPPAAETRPELSHGTTTRRESGSQTRDCPPLRRGDRPRYLCARGAGRV
jgi:hypothetical protein